MPGLLAGSGLSVQAEPSGRAAAHEDFGVRSAVNVVAAGALTVLRAALRREIRSSLEGGGSARNRCLTLGALEWLMATNCCSTSGFLNDMPDRIIAEPSVAIVELVANAWDAWAT